MIAHGFLKKRIADQLVHLARLHGPELLVLDEPFSGLDPLGVEAMERVLRQQAERGAAIVFSSHQLDLVQSICDDVTVVAAGRDLLRGWRRVPLSALTSIEFDMS